MIFKGSHIIGVKCLKDNIHKVPHDPSVQNLHTRSPNLLPTSTARGPKYASINDNFLKLS